MGQPIEAKRPPLSALEVTIFSLHLPQFPAITGAQRARGHACSNQGRPFIFRCFGFLAGTNSYFWQVSGSPRRKVQLRRRLVAFPGPKGTGRRGGMGHAPLKKRRSRV